MAEYIALVHKDEGTSYGVSFPDVPGCISAGDTLEEALANAAEALAGHLALMREDGEAEPKARGIEAIKADPEFKDEFSDALVRVVGPRRRPLAYGGGTREGLRHPAHRPSKLDVSVGHSIVKGNVAEASGVYRSAISGRFVSAKSGQISPKTTIKEPAAKKRDGSKGKTKK